jgi:CheY-like chemotaxis protein
LREGLYLQIAAVGGIPTDPRSPADMMLIDAGTGNVPNLTARPKASIPSLVLLTPNARGSLHDMREMGFAGYLVKPVRQSSLIARLQWHRDSPQETMPQPDRPDFDPPAIPAPFLDDSRRPQDRKTLRILLAEDNPINMMLIRELLRRRGHHVTEVTTGNDAVQAVLEDSFDLLLTDIHMPGMDGLEAARAIRAGEARMGKDRTPIVALTADALEGGKRNCRDAGMDGFLTKPVDPTELEEIFAALFPGEDGSNIVAA